MEEGRRRLVSRRFWEEGPGMAAPPSLTPSPPAHQEQQGAQDEQHQQDVIAGSGRPATVRRRAPPGISRIEISSLPGFDAAGVDSAVKQGSSELRKLAYTVNDASYSCPDGPVSSLQDPGKSSCWKGGMGDSWVLLKLHEKALLSFLRVRNRSTSEISVSISVHGRRRRDFVTVKRGIGLAHGTTTDIKIGHLPCVYVRIDGRSRGGSGVSLHEVIPVGVTARCVGEFMGPCMEDLTYKRTERLLFGPSLRTSLAPVCPPAALVRLVLPPSYLRPVGSSYDANDPDPVRKGPISGVGGHALHNHPLMASPTSPGDVCAAAIAEETREHHGVCRPFPISFPDAVSDSEDASGRRDRNRRVPRAFVGDGSRGGTSNDVPGRRGGLGSRDAGGGGLVSFAYDNEHFPASRPFPPRVCGGDVNGLGVNSCDRSGEGVGGGGDMLSPSVGLSTDALRQHHRRQGGANRSRSGDGFTANEDTNSAAAVGGGDASRVRAQGGPLMPSPSQQHPQHQWPKQRELQSFRSIRNNGWGDQHSTSKRGGDGYLPRRGMFFARPRPHHRGSHEEQQHKGNADAWRHENSSNRSSSNNSPRRSERIGGSQSEFCSNQVRAKGTRGPSNWGRSEGAHGKHVADRSDYTDYLRGSSEIDTGGEQGMSPSNQGWHQRAAA